MSKLETLDLTKFPFRINLCNTADHTYQGYFHYHQGLEILYVHRGQGSVVLEQQVHPIEPGTLFLFQPFQLHHIRVQISGENPYIRSVIHLEPNAFHPYVSPFKHLERFFLYLWKGNLNTQVFPRLNLRHPVEFLIADYKKKITGKADELEHELYGVFLTQLLLYLYMETAVQSSGELTALPNRAVTHTEAILQWIERNYAAPFQLDQLAKECHLSKYHISHLFKEETGRSVIEYVLARRVKEACHMLAASSLSVSEIGTRVGWPISSHFIQQFKRWVGCTPLQYRKKWRTAR